jgi:hypothetical protein
MAVGSEAIRGHQRPSEVIRGHQRSSEVIRGNQRSSEAIRGHQRMTITCMAVGSEATDAVEAGGAPSGVGARYGAPK